MENIAKRVIDRLGGAPVVARIIELDVSQVYRWTYPKKRGGTGGLVPAQYQQPLLDWAKENNKDLSPEYFFRLAECSETSASANI